MENQTASSKQVILNYGLMLGILSVIISVANYAVGNAFDPHWSIQVIGIALMIVLIIMGLKKFKETNDGFLKLGQALKIGIGITLISTLISIAYFLVFSSFIEPDFYEIIGQVQEQKWIDAGMTDEQIEMNKGMMEKMSGPAISSAFMVAGGLFIGFIISLISGLIMKKTEQEVTSI